MRPTFRRERAHGGRVAGVDEAGRGPLAGPVVAAAVVFASGCPPHVARTIDDSKKLEPAERLAAARLIRRHAEIGIGAASVAEIATHNIFWATMLAMRRALARLPAPPELALIDGNRAPRDLPCAHECVVDGDALHLSVAAASIMAKTTRDRAMTRLHARYPAYRWDENAGYATPVHRAALQAHGPCRHHRTAFGTVRLLLEGEAAD